MELSFCRWQVVGWERVPLVWQGRRVAGGPEPHRWVHSEVPVTSRSVFPKSAVPVLESFSVVHCSSGVPWWLRGKTICLQCRRPGFNPWVRNILWRREQLPTPVFSSGEFHGQRSLMGYSPWGSQRERHDWATFTLEWKQFIYVKTYILHLHTNLCADFWFFILAVL